MPVVSASSSSAEWQQIHTTCNVLYYTALQLMCSVCIAQQQIAADGSDDEDAHSLVQQCYIYIQREEKKRLLHCTIKYFGSVLPMNGGNTNFHSAKVLCSFKETVAGQWHCRGICVCCPIIWYLLWAERTSLREQVSSTRD